jgi:tRNA(Ile2) C34 agmatinyltransferase TiaS|tara:strand:+ start:300 stop:485 length:186 start_codon:yes stop_codon:yes gene_type:complete
MTWFNLLKSKVCPKCGEPMKRKGKGWRKQVGEWYCPKCSSKLRRWNNPPPIEETYHRGKVR